MNNELKTPLLQEFIQAKKVKFGCDLVKSHSKYNKQKKYQHFAFSRQQQDGQ